MIFVAIFFVIYLCYGNNEIFIYCYTGTCTSTYNCYIFKWIVSDGPAIIIVSDNYNCFKVNLHWWIKEGEGISNKHRVRGDGPGSPSNTCHPLNGLFSGFIVPYNDLTIFWPAKADVATTLKRNGNLTALRDTGPMLDTSSIFAIFCKIFVGIHFW